MRITRVLVGWSLCLTAGIAAACSGPQPPPFKPVVDVKLMMQSVVDPQADVIWESVHTVITKEGTKEIRPRTEQEWETVRNAAVVLTESGNLLMMVPRAYDAGDWMTMSQRLVDVGSAALKAAQGKNVDGIWDVGENIDNVCEACHQEYAYENAPKRKR